MFYKFLFYVLNFPPVAFILKSVVMLITRVQFFFLKIQKQQHFQQVLTRFVGLSPSVSVRQTAAGEALQRTVSSEAWMRGRAAGPGRSAYSTMAFISVEDPSSQTAGWFLQPTASQSKLGTTLKWTC